jgi:spore maturation protein CgeB
LTQRLQILYLGSKDSATTSFHRGMALCRLGNRVEILDLFDCLRKHLHTRVGSMFHYRTGYRCLQRAASAIAKSKLESLRDKVDLIWVDGGELVGPRVINVFRTLGCPIILYSIDDPTGARDGQRFAMVRRTIPQYDLSVVVRNESVDDFMRFNARRVLRVWRSYDEIAHARYEDNKLIPEQFRSEVAFIGTWMRYEDRDRFLTELVNRSIPISIWGNGWKKSRFWSTLEPYYRGENLNGRDYVSAIQGAKVNLGFLSKGNRDLHTTRSLETPYAGGLLCAERTSEHLELYGEGQEAVFWSTPEECASICTRLLADDNMRESIRSAGMKRVRELKVGNEDICQQILDELKKDS